MKFMESLISLWNPIQIQVKSRISKISLEKCWKKEGKGEKYKKSITLGLSIFLWRFSWFSPFFTFFHLFSPFLDPSEHFSRIGPRGGQKKVKKGEERWKKVKISEISLIRPGQQKRPRGKIFKSLQMVNAGKPVEKSMKSPLPVSYLTLCGPPVR